MFSDIGLTRSVLTYITQPELGGCRTDLFHKSRDNNGSITCVTLRAPLPGNVLGEEGETKRQQFK